MLFFRWQSWHLTLKNRVYVFVIECVIAGLNSCVTFAAYGIVPEGVRPCRRDSNAATSLLQRRIDLLSFIIVQ